MRTMKQVHTVKGRRSIRPMLLTMVFCLIAITSRSQHIAPLLHPPTSSWGSGFHVGLDKIANTYVWIGNADVDIPTEYVNIRWVNAFRSTAVRTQTMAIRDVEETTLSLEMPIDSSQWSTIVRSHWSFSRDNRNIGLSSLERLGGVGGVRWKPSDFVTAEAIGGVERLTQLGVAATGPIAGITAKAQNVDVDEWQMSLSGLADWNRVDELRTNTDMDLRAEVIKNIDGMSYLKLGATWLDLRRDFITNVTSPAGSLPAIESRGEGRLTAVGEIVYEIASGLSVSAVGQAQMNGIDRSYAEPVADVPITAVDRRLDELIVDISGGLTYSSPNVMATAVATVYRRDERNGVSTVFDVDDVIVDGLRAQENQRDNTTFTSKFVSTVKWTPSKHDTLQAEYTGFLTRYDTPSDLNYDDRDELSIVAALTYSRRMSDVLSASLTLSSQNVHFVFIKAQRSAQNFVNRVIRFVPRVDVTSSVITMSPRIEVLANYFVYDFEETGSATRSYSLRQISYRDSMRINLVPGWYLAGSVLLRRAEQASLLWGDFAEVPQLRTTEYLAKMLIFSATSESWTVGAGIRAYMLEQQSLAPGGLSPTSSLHWLAPETMITYRTPNGSELSLSGWYEFRRVNITGRTELPNLLLHTRITL